MDSLRCILAILFTVKGLGGTFNHLFVSLHLAQIHGPVVGGIIASLMFASFFNFRRPSENSLVPISRTQKGIFLGVVSVLFLLSLAVRIHGIRNSPLVIDQADMLPTILTQITDFLNGKLVYGPRLLSNGNLVVRYYLPTLWGSYLPFFVMGVDIRYLNLLAQLVFASLWTVCFLKRGNYFNWKFNLSAATFCGLLALQIFSKESLGEVLTVQTGPFWLFYSLLVWAAIEGKFRWVDFFIPLVILCRQPAFLLIVPYWIYLARFERAQFWRSFLVTGLLGFFICSPFLLREPRGFFAGVGYYAGLVNQTSLPTMLSWYGLIGLLRALGLTFLQVPIQISVLVGMSWVAFHRKNLDAIQALGLGGIIYLSFMLLTPVTYKYLFAEPLLLCYFLLNCPANSCPTQRIAPTEKLAGPVPPSHAI